MEPQPKRLALRPRARAQCRRKMLVTGAVLKLVHDLDHAGCIFFRPSGRGKTFEIGRQHFVPVDTHLPGAALIGEENDIVQAFVNVPRQAESDFDRFRCFAPVSFSGGSDAMIEEMVELRDPSACAS